MREEFLWVEKYRPVSINECILPESLRKTFDEFLMNEEIPNLLLAGGPGVGKTTVARAICEQLDTDYILINGSEESGIDILRNKIKNFASTVSLGGKNKVVILDEADYLNPQSTQPALRGFIEEFSKSCRFIFTCNFINKIISPLHSRCSVIEFKIGKGEIPSVATQFMERMCSILNSESIKYSTEVIAQLIKKHFPDWRRIINELQRYAAGGEIDVGILTDLSEINIKLLVDSLKSKEFVNMRKWVVDNIDNDVNLLFKKLYDSMGQYLSSDSIPQLVLIVADYQYKSAFVVDQEINMVACLTEIMANCEFM